MKINVVRYFSYNYQGNVVSFDEGEQEVPDELAEIALGCGWATVVDEERTEKVITRAPRTKKDD